MRKQGSVAALLIVLACSQFACVSNLWTGASLIYDRHNVYKKIDDYHLAAQAGHQLYDDRLFKQPGCSLDLAVFNNDILLAGHVPTDELRDLAESRLRQLKGYRRLFSQIAVKQESSNLVTDSWITTKIRSQILADSSIDPHEFKIITSDGIVYVMGDVKPNQATRVLDIARNTHGVVRVVKLLKYYNLSKTPA